MKYVLTLGMMASLSLAADSFTLSSSSFKNGENIPAKFATEKVDGGANTSPELSWTGAPADTKSFAVTCIDLHPMARRWVHWMIIDIPADVSKIGEGVSGVRIPEGAIELDNSFGDEGWGGPQPPKGSGKHEYCFTVYALSTGKIAANSESLSEKDFIKIISWKILAKAELKAYFSR